MIVTLDVSAAIELVLKRPKHIPIMHILQQAEWVISPSLFIYETANVMWKYSQLGQYSTDYLFHKTRQALKLVDEYLPSDSLFEEAIALAIQINHAAYDAMYLVTSRRRNAALITLDSRLADAAAAIKIPLSPVSKSLLQNQ